MVQITMVSTNTSNTPHMAWLGRLVGGGGRMGHRGGAEAGLVGEHPTGKSLLHGRHDGVAKDAPSHCHQS